MYTTSDLKKGLIIEFEDAPYAVESVSVSAPSARGASTIHKVRLRNLKTRQKVDKSFRGGDNFSVPDFEKRNAQFLYKDGDSYHFMDMESYDQFYLPTESLEWEANFLKEEMEVQSLVYNDAVIGLEMPDKVNLKIVETPPAMKGASATARTKPATLETGHMVQVPEHISTGELVGVDTRTGDFLGRAR